MTPDTSLLDPIDMADLDTLDPESPEMPASPADTADLMAEAEIAELSAQQNADMLHDADTGNRAPAMAGIEDLDPDGGLDADAADYWRMEMHLAGYGDAEIDDMDV